MKYKVIVTRKTIDNRTIIVEAGDPSEARQLAEEEAICVFWEIPLGSDIVSYSTNEPEAQA